MSTRVTPITNPIVTHHITFHLLRPFVESRCGSAARRAATGIKSRNPSVSSERPRRFAWRVLTDTVKDVTVRNAPPAPWTNAKIGMVTYHHLFSYSSVWSMTHVPAHLLLLSPDQNGFFSLPPITTPKRRNHSRVFFGIRKKNRTVRNLVDARYRRQPTRRHG